MSKTEIPSIRFRGFDNDWEQRKLGDVYSPLTERNTDLLPYNRTLSVATMTYKTDGNGAADSSLANYKRLRIGDIAFEGHTSKEYRYGRFVLNDAGDGIMSPRFSALRPLAQMPITFWKYYIHYEPIMRKVLVNSTKAGTMMNELVVDEFLKSSLYVPSKEEQACIGDYFTVIDHLITLHQRKFEKLTNVKKSMLEKMFPQNGSSYPEIRFKGFTDPWEQRKLGEVATFINGRAYSQPELLSSGKYKVLRVGNFYTNDSWYYSDLELGEKYYADYGDLLYTWSATFGPHIWLGDRVIYHYHIWKINLSDQLEKQFAVQLLEQDRANILSSKNGSTMVHITKEGMEQKDVIIPPSTKEQQEIGAFFLQLDNLITLHQRELEKLQSIQKALLEKMFV